jgi:cyclohexanecarboxylate-CoA ligase
VREVSTRFIERAATQDWCAVVDDEGSWSARQVLAEAQELAVAIEAIGVLRPTLLVQSENSRRLVAAALAVGILDGTLALASTHMSVEDVSAAIEDTRPDFIVADPAQLERWALSASDRVGAGLRGWAVARSTGDPTPGRWGGGVVIGMTSGSTGRSKGVVHSEASMRYAVQQEIAAVGLVATDAIGIIVPLSAAPAFAFGIYTALELQSTAVMSSKWNPASALDQLADNNARWLMCVPTQVLQLAEAAKRRPGALAGMKAITVGGGPMDVDTLREAEEALGTTVLRVFGMAECLGHTTPALADRVAVRLGRDGRPFPGTELRVLDEAGNEMPTGEVGRAQVRGPSLFLGYAKSGRLMPPPLTPDGFFETGDLIAKDGDGTIKVMGRIKDVIIRGGRNISIAEVESALLGDGRIGDVCVVAVPDRVLGERVAALVVTNVQGLSLGSVCERLASAGVSKIKWPEFLIAVKSIPRTEVGKVSRVQARELATRAVSGAA